MALSGPALGDAIVSAIQGVSEPNPADGGTTFLKAYWEAIGTAIVNYIKSNAVVNPGSLAIIPADITAPPAGGPCSGSGTVATGTGTVIAMADISIDLTKGSDTYGDLLIVNGDLALTSDVNPNGTNPILQDMLTRLRMFLGEWFMDSTQGIPWFQQILVKGYDQSKVDAIFVNSLLNTPGVLQLNSYSFSVNSSLRVLTVNFSAETTSGTVDYSGNIVPVGGLV
jgi:hypothetical protein